MLCNIKPDLKTEEKKRITSQIDFRMVLPYYIFKEKQRGELN